MTAPPCELLPCPFCGKSRAKPLSIRDGTQVTCPDCFAAGPPAYAPQSRDGAIAGWNTRAAPAPTVAQPAEPKRNRCVHDRWPGDDCDICPAPAEPPATDDLVMRDKIMSAMSRPAYHSAHWSEWPGTCAFADAALSVVKPLIERQAREIAELRAEIGAARDAVQLCATHAGELERAEVERDALREVVKAADAMRLGEDCPMCDSGKLRNPAKEHWDTCAFANYDAARAKVKP